MQSLIKTLALALVKGIKDWMPVILRGALWTGIAMLTEFRHSVEDILTSNTVVIPTPKLVDMVAGTLLAGMLSLRTFLDTTVSRHTEKLEDKANGGNGSSGSTVTKTN